MKLILRKIPQSDHLIAKILKDFSNTFEIKVSPGRPSPAKRIREESPQNEISFEEDVETSGKTQIF